MGWNYYTSGGELVASATTLDGFTSADFVAITGSIMSGPLTIAQAGGTQSQLRITDTTAGAGLTIGGDTNLYRSAANVLKTDDTFWAVGSIQANGNIEVLGNNLLFRHAAHTNENIILQGRRPVDTAARVNLYNSGKIEMGDGTAALDTNLYRSAAGILKTDNSLTVAGTLSPVGGYAHVTASAAISLTTANHFVGLLTSTAGAGFTATLPAQVTSVGKEFILIDVENNANVKNVTVAVQAGEKLNGVTNGTSVINTAGASRKLISFGALGWFTF